MISIIHSGQGSQQVDMFDGFPSYKIFNETVEEASDILGKNIRTLASPGNKNLLDLTENSQISVTVMNVAIDRLWKSLGGEISFRAGHSVGEFSAYCSAESLSFADMLRAVQFRSKIMTETISPWMGGMLSVMDMETDRLTFLLRDYGNLAIACFNSPTRHVVTGLRNSLDNLASVIVESGARCFMLDISIPCHSSFMYSCVRDMEIYLNGIKFMPPAASVVNSANGKILKSVDEIVSGLASQIYLPVQWINVIEYLIFEKTRNFIVFGTKSGRYDGMIRSMCREIKTYVVHDEQSLEKVLILTS